MCKIDILLFGNIPNNNCAFFIISSSFYCIKLSIFCFGTANADYVLIWIMLHKYGTGSGYLGLKAFTLFLLAWWILLFELSYFFGNEIILRRKVYHNSPKWYGMNSYLAQNIKSTFCISSVHHHCSIVGDEWKIFFSEVVRKRWS